MIHFASKYTTTEPLCKEFAVQLSFLLWLRRVLLNCCPRLRASSHLGDICHLGSRRTGRRTESRGRIQLNQISPSFDMEFQSSLKWTHTNSKCGLVQPFRPILMRWIRPLGGRRHLRCIWSVQGIPRSSLGFTDLPDTHLFCAFVWVENVSADCHLRSSLYLMPYKHWTSN